MSGRNDIPMPGHRRIKKDILFRLFWVCLGFLGASMAILLWVITIQFGPNGRPLRELSDSQCYRVQPIFASRGNILSRDMKLLATEAPYYNIRLDFSLPDLTDSLFRSNVGALADSLQNLLGNTSSYYRQRLETIYSRARAGGSGSKDQLLVNRIDQLQMDRMRTFPLLSMSEGGMKARKDTVLYLPYGSLASYTIGRPGSHGLEYFYDSYLRGENGQNRYVRLVRSNWVPVVDSENRDPVNGCDLVTTLDIDMQDVAETALRRQMSAAQALTGTAVVMEVETGEIRVMTNLTHYPSGLLADDFNYATNMRNEPGSSFKLVSLLALLQDRGLPTDYTIECSKNGREVINHTLVTDTHDTPSGTMTIREMTAMSSNIGFAKVIDEQYRSDPARFVSFVRSLGIDRPANIQAQTGALSPVIKDPSRPRETDWNQMTLTKMAYGYAVEVTPLHTLMLYNAVANGGVMLAPMLVKEIRRDGRTVERFKPEVINQSICSERVAREAKLCLQEVVESGTASLLKNEHYTVAGKTGTAQVAQGSNGYRTADGGMDYLATLVGFFPVEKPKYSCIVAIKTHHAPGQGNSYYGAQLAGPVFKEIIDYIYTADSQWREKVRDTLEMPDLRIKGGNAEDIRYAAGHIGISSVAARERGWLNVRRDSVLVAEQVQSGTGKMPDVRGMGLKDALFILEGEGLRVSFSGSGSVVSQTPSRNEPVRKGETVTIRLARSTR